MKLEILQNSTYIKNLIMKKVQDRLFTYKYYDLILNCTAKWSLYGLGSAEHLKVYIINGS